MKYKLLQKLPFMSVGDVFGKGSWVGGGWGVDRGTNKHGAHNGVTVFTDHENALLDSILENSAWIERIPENNRERLELYESGRITKDEFLAAL